MINSPPVALAAPDTLDRWPAFMRAVRKRLEAGRREYGAESFARDPAELLGELEEEALDLAGWGFVLWHRIESMQERLAGGVPEGWGDDD
jgi:hypothetical protein